MKILLWLTVGVVGAFWTAGFALLASLAQWLAGAGQQVAGAVQQVAEWPVPGWMAIWANPAWMEAMRAALTSTLDSSATYVPWLFSALGWVAPLLWILWGLGMLLLLLLAVAGHGLIRRAAPSEASLR